MRAILTASTGTSPPCLPPAPASGSWPQRRSRTTPSASTAPPPRRAARNSDHQAAPYRHALVAGGGPELDPDELGLGYRQGSLYAYVAALITAGMGGMQAESIALEGVR